IRSSGSMRRVSFTFVPTRTATSSGGCRWMGRRRRSRLSAKASRRSSYASHQIHPSRSGSAGYNPPVTSRTLPAVLVTGFLSACSAPNATDHTVKAAAPSAAALPAPTPAPSKEALIARARPLELSTPYEPPPGDPLEHNTSGYAKTMCSAVFITGLDPDVAAESVGYFTGPYEERKKVGKPVIDREKKEIHISLPNGVIVTARHFGSQGCIA